MLAQYACTLDCMLFNNMKNAVTCFVTRYDCGTADRCNTQPQIHHHEDVCQT